MTTSPRINREALEALLESRTPEGRHHEYKQALPSSSDRDVKEFLADVSSFANSSGGLLVIGIREDGGLPVEVVGLNIDNIDAEIARLDAFIRDGIEPRIPGVQIAPHRLSGNLVLAIDVPRSWALPH